VRGASLSVGAHPNAQGLTRVGLRTRRGLKGAVERNRLKRQVRAVLGGGGLSFRPGLDLVIVIHPQTLPMRSGTLKAELLSLCRKARILLP
jgi:ribonuclease P protein component